MKTTILKRREFYEEWSKKYHIWNETKDSKGKQA